MNLYIMGIDVGTEGVKAVLLDDTGKLITSVQESYTFDVPRPGWTEQDPEIWWEAVKAALSQLSQKGISLTHVRSIGLTGQMHSAVLLRKDGSIVRKAILWNDQRTEQQCEEIKEKLGLASLLEQTCNTALPGFTAPKLLWLREHEPNSYQEIATVLMPKDYIRYKLTGVAAADVTDASGTGLFDVEKRDWNRYVMEQLELPIEWFPPVYESHSVVGTIHSQAAKECGLSVDVPVVAGAGDNAAAAVGNAVLSPESGMISVGTSGVVFVPLRYVPLPNVRKEGNPTVHLFCHAMPETWHAMGVTLAAGGSLRWYRDAFAKGSSYDELVLRAANLPAGSEGLTFLPYLTGERTPHNHPNARGVFFGMSLKQEQAHFIRAVLEGVCYSILDCIEVMEKYTSETSSFVLTGGIVKSDMWSQMLCDILGKPLQIPPSFEGPAIGAALLAGVGTGVFGDLDGIRTHESVQPQILHPNKAQHEIYCTTFLQYKRLYEVLRPIF